jgi:hypothetical protein
MRLADLEDGRVYTAAELRELRALPSVRRAETADIRNLVERVKQTAATPPEQPDHGPVDPFAAVAIDEPEPIWR